MSKTPTDKYKTIKEQCFFEKVGPGPGICKNVIMFIGVYLFATILHIAVQHCIRLHFAWTRIYYIARKFCAIFILILWSSAMKTRVPFFPLLSHLCKCRLQVCRVLADNIFFFFSFTISSQINETIVKSLHVTKSKHL